MHSICLWPPGAPLSPTSTPAVGESLECEAASGVGFSSDLVSLTQPQCTQVPRAQARWWMAGIQPATHTGPKGSAQRHGGWAKYSCRLNRKGKSPVPLLGVEPGPQAPNQKPLASPPKPLRWGTFLLQPRQGALYDESCFSTWAALSTFLGSKGRRHRGHRGDGTCRHGWRHSPQNLQGAGDTGLRLPACACTHGTAPLCCQLHVSGDGHF